MLIKLLAFLVTIGTLVVIHEYGHYKVARWCGVKVLRFSVGFGKVLWRRAATATSPEFTLCALPLGGYVRMLDSREGRVAPEELSQAFDRKPLRQRVAIVSAGPLANLLLAILVYAAAQWTGVTEPRALMSSPVAGSMAAEAGVQAGDLVRAVAIGEQGWEDIDTLVDWRWQLSQGVLARQALRLQLDGPHPRQVVLPLDRLPVGSEIDLPTMQRIGLMGVYRDPVLNDVKTAGPAAQAGLLRGDRVLSIDGAVVADAQSLIDRVRGAAGRTTMWLVERHGQRLEVSVTPRAVTEGGQTLGRIDAGVGGAVAMVTIQRGLVDGLARGWTRMIDTASLSLKTLGRMLIGQASIKNLSGPLTIADAAGETAQRGLADYLNFLAAVSVSLGVLNLLPLPMLDGGHLMYYLFEGVTGRPVSDVWLKWLQRGGAFVLLLMMSIALSNDVARQLGLQ